MQNRWGFFLPRRGENTFGSVKAPFCLFRFTESTFSFPSEGEKAPNSSNCLWRFSLGEVCRFSPGTQQGAPSFIGRGSLEERGLLEVQMDHKAGSSRDKWPSKHLHSNGAKRGAGKKSKKKTSRPRRSPRLKRNFFTQLRSWKRRGCGHLLLLRQPRLKG